MPGRLAMDGFGLVFPTGMAIGRNGAFYVSQNGFGFPAGAGEILKITTH